MRIFLTGGAGDLGQMLSSSLLGMGHQPLIYDVKMADIKVETDENKSPTIGSTITPGVPKIQYVSGSVLDRAALKAAMKGCDIIVHIAAWHGIHEARGEKNACEFFDLNVSGTFNVFQSAVEANIKNIVFISSTSVDEKYGLYGNTKVLGEEIADAYAHRHGLNVITLRPRAFIPPWNRHAYSSFLEWCRWFSRGAVHISDVAQAVVKSIELLEAGDFKFHEAPLLLTVDGAYQYTTEDLENWDADGPGSTFKKYYAKFYDLAVASGLEPHLKPKRLDITKTETTLNYRPLYSMKTLLLELKMYGAAGPYADRE